MIIREVKFEDYSQIKNLANRFNINVYEQNEWEIIWKNNPYLKDNKIEWPLGWVIEVENKIVGHIGNIPTQYFYNSQSYNGSIISCWVVEPKYRLYSIKLIQKYLSQSTKDFHIATTSNLKTARTLSAFGWKEMPNKDYNKKLYIVLNTKAVLFAFIKKSNFYSNNFINNLINFGINIFLSKKINYWKKFKKENNFEIHNQFDNQFDEMWEKLKIYKKNTFHFNRSSKWLNWHLNSKIKNKNSFILTKKEEGKIIAYAICVFKYVKDLSIKKAVLVDLVSIKDYEKTYFDLVLFSINNSFKSGCDIFEIVGFSEEKRKIMKKIRPFEKKNTFSPFYFITKNQNLNKILLKRENWDPSELDGDSIY